MMSDTTSPAAWRVPGAALLGLFLIALLFVHGFTLDAEDYWYDELFTWNVAALPSFGAIWERLETDTSPPLYFWALHVWHPAARTFGLSYRWLSVAGAMLGLAGFYFWMRRGFGDRMAALAAALLGFSPFWITYAQELRMYSLYPAFLWWGAYFLLRGMASGKRSDWIIWAAANALALWTHYHAAFFILAEMIAVGLFWRRALKSDRDSIRRGLFAGGATFVLLVAPLLALLPHQIASSLGNISWLRFPHLSHIITNFVIDYTIFSYPLDPVWEHVERMGSLMFYVLLVAGAVIKFRRLRSETLNHRYDRHQTRGAVRERSGNAVDQFSMILLLCTAFIPPVLMIILSFLPVKFYTPGRYAILSLAPFLGCLALGVRYLVAGWGLRALLIALMIGLNLISWWQILGFRHKPAWSHLARAVDKHVAEDDVVLGFPDFWFNGFGMYLERDVPVLDFREYVLSEPFDIATSRTFALIFNLSADEDEFYPWKVLHFLQMHSEARRVYWDPWHTVMRLKDVRNDRVRDWYLRRHLTGREEVFAWNPLWFVGAEDLGEWLPEHQFAPSNLTYTGELTSWLIDPPVRFAAPLTLQSGSYTIVLKANVRLGANPPPVRLTLRVNGHPVQTFLVEDSGAARFTARFKMAEALPHPTIEWDGTSFRPIDVDPESTDERRLFFEFYWMAIVKDDVPEPQ